MFEYNIGVRDHYEYKDAMFTNSLFHDFLKENGLKIWKDESTRDIICLEFNFGSRSLEEEIKHLKELGRKSRLEYKLAKSRNYKKQMIRQYNKRKKIANYFKKPKTIKIIQKYSKEEIRRIFYNDGVNVEYITL